jgi:hypothetical protein
MRVLPITSQETYSWLLRVHYAKRIPSISYSFGLFIDNDLKGIVTYGTPSSSTLRDGVAGKAYSGNVLELNRLVFIETIKNGASALIGRSLRYLPMPSIVVSYADTSQGHVGYVYQSCNFIYTGLSAKRTDWKLKGMENLHGQTIADMSRGVESQQKGDRAKFMRQKFGDDFYLEDRPRKHRYIFINARKKEKNAILKSLLYKPEPYPKGESSRYEITYIPEKQLILF